MLETFYQNNTLDTPAAYLAAFIIGIAFGFILEKAGFGSSRRLAGVFYFRDMAVIKVMFTGLIVAMLCLLVLRYTGVIDIDNVYFLPTLYREQIIGGLVFGVGFALSGWCPGTGAVGLASGRIDALVFIVGAIIGSVFYNELFDFVKLTQGPGKEKILFIYDLIGLTPQQFAFFFTLLAVLSFWGSEYIEKRKGTGGSLLKSPFLVGFIVALMAAATLLLIYTGPFSAMPAAKIQESDHLRQELFLPSTGEKIDRFMSPEELAERMMGGNPNLIVIDIRTRGEYDQFHLRGARYVPKTDLLEVLTPYSKKNLIVLYSSQETPSAIAGESLSKSGYNHVYYLSGGLQGFIRRCLKPVSLRGVPVSPEMAAKINSWRSFFTMSYSAEESAVSDIPLSVPTLLPGLVKTDWLHENLGRRNLVLIDCRTQPEYNSGHIPGSLYLNAENIRGSVRGVPSSLLPPEMLAYHFSLMGIVPEDLIVLVADEQFRDATYVGLAFERLGHIRYAILDGGFRKWTGERRPVDTILPPMRISRYPAYERLDMFSVDALYVLQALNQAETLIIDARPTEYFTGKKTEEARPGHIPGAVNRPISEDLLKSVEAVGFKSLDELEKAYGELIPNKETKIIVYCRTGHQASQTYFVLKNLLGYPSVFWYDGSWTEWSARPELPAAMN